MNKSNHFINHLNDIKKKNFHNNTFIEELPNNIQQIPNIIIYGSNNIGKYYYCLKLLKKYSPSSLKYEKKISISACKSIYTYKISDIHIDIDIEFLGCNAKLLWNIIYNHIYDIACIKPNKHFIMVCKNFNKIHSELLDTFYSYMQKNYFNPITISFILITNTLSFIPNNILNASKLVCLKLPNKQNLKTYNNIYNKKTDKYKKIMLSPYIKFCNTIIDMIIKYKNIKLLELREVCYSILVLQFDIPECINYILNKLIATSHINNKNIHIILVKTAQCLKYYNNNYRSIYHLESYVITLIKYIHDIE